MNKILIIEDNVHFAQSIAECFSTKLYHIEFAQNGQIGYKIARENQFDLIILDILLPQKNGLAILKQLRSEFIETPVLVMTSESESEKLYSALEYGADAFLHKPFNLLELKLRVDCLLKRPPSSKLAQISYRNITLDQSNNRVLINNQEMHLRRKEFQLLEYFLKHPEQTISRPQLINNIWKEAEEPYFGSIDVHICRIRQQLHTLQNEVYIKTLCGIGYRLEEKPQPK